MRQRIASWLKGKSAAADDAGGQRRQRFLVSEILTLQLLITAVIGALAISSVYWGAQWVLQKSYSRWAMQWTEELHELGAPLYVSYDDEVTTRLERYIDKYPEIKRVTYYRLDGSALFSISAEPAWFAAEPQALPRHTLRRASELMGAEAPYLIESSILNVRAFQMHAPIWTESILSDGLFDFDPLAEAPRSEKELVGFVGVDLDFVDFHDHLVANIETAIVVLGALLIVSGLAGRLLLLGALKPISDLQAPIAQLAEGNLAVKFQPAAHREISDIVEALQSTVAALGERDAELTKLADHDPLTGLYNRRRFARELTREIESLSAGKRSSALLFIDLDRFKYVNDIGGHPAGDRLIQRVAELLLTAVAEQGIVGRFGGDEFAVLACDVSKREAKALAEQILDAMRREQHVEGDKVFHIHCSVGITMIHARNRDEGDVLAQADIACREAKARGRNRLAFYDAAEHESERVIADVGWISKLREALDGGQFVLQYQPVVDIRSGTIVHHEVLLRMRADGGKLIAPDAFLPAAARFGLMADIDLWVVAQSLTALATLRRDDPGLKLAINLSANALELDSLAATVRSHLKKRKIPPENVAFEVSESLAVRHLADVEEQLAGLREVGCEVGLDDFGTGYSSFGHLRRLSVDYLKIDGSVVGNLEAELVDRKTVELIGELAAASGMKTVAESVENETVLGILRDLGIDYAQGFHVAAPADAPVASVALTPPRARRARKG